MSPQLKQITDKQPNYHEGHPNFDGNKKIIWFAKQFPKFFTKSIINNRTAPLVIKPTQPSKQNLFMLQRRVSHSKTDFIRLERVSVSALKFTYEISGESWTIQSTILVSMVVTLKTNHVSEWVGIRIKGGPTITVKRNQLLTALRFFKILA